MPLDSTTRQQLLELVYDLLPEAEAAELRRRMQSDAELAQAFAEAQATASLAAQAARRKAPALDYRSLQKLATSDSPRAKAMARGRARQRSRRSRGVTWSVGLVAGLLLAVSLGGYVYHRQQLAALAESHLRLVVTGPSRLQPEAPSIFNVATSDVAGNPVVADVELSVSTPLGQQLLRQTDQTDRQGTLQVIVPADLRVRGDLRIEVEAKAGRNLEKFDSPLEVAPPRYLAYVETDRPRYRPGDLLRYRCLVLSHFRLSAGPQTPLQVEILDPKGKAVPGSRQTVSPTTGLAVGSWRLPAQAATGRYQCVVSGDQDLFAPQRSAFDVAPVETAGASLEVAFPRESYRAGEAVVTLVSVRKSRPEPHVSLEATVDGKNVFRTVTQANAEGNLRVEFVLPKSIARGDGELKVSAHDGRTTVASTTRIPIDLGSVDVRFVPEGGELAAGLYNRVYFVARTPQGQPCKLRGVLLDSRDEEVALLESTHNGLGQFGFTPAAGEQYRVKVFEPSGVRQDVRLSAVSPDQRVVLNTGPGVFEAGRPLEFDLYASKDHLPLVVSAWCRGVQVGQQTLVTAKTQQTPVQHVVLPLPADVAGVIRLTIYDFRSTHPRPIAERLVFRRPQQRLQLQMEPEDLRYQVGQPLDLALRVTDEKDTPVPAVLRASVLNESVGPAATAPTSSDMAYFLLTSELERPEEVKDADFYLADDARSTLALDLLLGTQGWRRFVERTLQQIRDEGRSDRRLAELAALGAAGKPPLMYDNLGRIRDQYQQSLRLYRAERTRLLETVTAVSFFGGFGLVLFVAMLAMLNVISGIRLWVPTLGAAMSCVIIGAILMDPDRLRSARDQAVAFAPYQPRSSEVDGESLARGARGEAAGKTDALRTTIKDEKKTLDKDAFGTPAAPSAAFGKEAGESPVAQPAASPRPTAPAADHRIRTKSAPAKAEMALPEMPSSGVRSPAAAPSKAADSLDVAPKAPVTAKGSPAPAESRPALSPPAAVRANESAVSEREAPRQQAPSSTASPAPGLGGQEFRERQMPTVDESLLRQQPARQTDGSLMQQLARPADRSLKAGGGFLLGSDAAALRDESGANLLWDPKLPIDPEGRTRIRFQTPSVPARLRIQLDAQGEGRLGSRIVQAVVQAPLTLALRLPEELTAGDHLQMQTSLSNALETPLAAEMRLDSPAQLQLEGPMHRRVEIPPQGQGYEDFRFKAQAYGANCLLNVTALAANVPVAQQESLSVVPAGYPGQSTTAGWLDGEREVLLETPANVAPGSLDVVLRVFPAAWADLQGASESLQAEPGASAEHVATLVQLDSLLLRQVEENSLVDAESVRRIRQRLQDNLKLLATFESASGGFDWFGGSPAPETLTAYCLVALREAERFAPMESRLQERTSAWLLRRRDGKGLFHVSAGVTGAGFSQECAAAYILGCLDPRAKGLETERKRVLALASSSKDRYLLALVAASGYVQNGDRKGLLDKLGKFQREDGRVEAGSAADKSPDQPALTVPTTALAALAWLRSPAYASRAQQAVDWLVAARRGSGDWGSPQATLLAAQALVEHARAARKPLQKGKLTVKQGTPLLAEAPLGGDRPQLVAIRLGAKVVPGKIRLTLSSGGAGRVAYLLTAGYHQAKAPPDAQPPLHLAVQLDRREAAQGERVTLRAELSNPSGEPLGLTLARLRLPAGLEPIAAELDALKKSGTVDQYEQRGREVVLYWRSYAAARKTTIKLELQVALAGKFTSLPSLAYVNSAPQACAWAAPLSVSTPSSAPLAAERREPLPRAAASPRP